MFTLMPDFLAIMLVFSNDNVADLFFFYLFFNVRLVGFVDFFVSLFETEFVVLD